MAVCYKIKVYTTWEIENCNVFFQLSLDETTLNFVHM